MVCEKNPSVRVLVLITTDKLAKKAADIFDNAHIPIQYGAIAEGTASSEILDMLGLGSTEKRLFISMLPKMVADNMLRKLHNELGMNNVNSGIAFTIAMTGANNLLLRLITKISENEEGEAEIENIGKGDDVEMEEKKSVLIAAVMNRGFSSDVMIAAREAGARGGTVVHARQLINEETAGFWGVNINEEKEILLIISDIENKVNIMKAISDRFGMQSEAKGNVISLPIDCVMGL
ncbi:MAG: transposase [Ruminococcaceae bacterium]|nr:transposase [Oscillospiraceae bacterium]